MFVYLDTSHFYLLERLSATKPERAADFIQRWVSRGHTLALSLNHAQEIAQLADDGSRQRRFDLIDQFPKRLVRSSHRGSASLLDLEIIIEVSALAGIELIPSEDLRDVIFDGDFEDFKDDVEENLASFHKGLALRATLSAALNQVAESGRQMEAIRVAENLQKINLGDPEFDWDSVWRLVESTIPAEAEDNPAGRVLVGHLRHMHQLIRKHRDVRSGLEELYGLSGMEVTPRLRPTDLPAASVFFASARNHIHQMSSDRNVAPLSFVTTLLPKLNPYRMPGYSLAIAVGRARQLSGSVVTPGDQLDEDHIAFAPYVDMMLVDKRTLAFLNQEVRDRPEFLIQLPEGRVRFAGTLEMLEDILFR